MQTVSIQSGQTFVKTISNPSTPKLCEFVKKQEACRKDVERAFGVLQQRFAIVRFPAMTWSKDQMWEVMNCCVCLHNMIIENERKHPVPLAEQQAPYEREGPLAQPNHRCRHHGPPSLLCARRSETLQCINSCKMIWWSTYGRSEATPTPTSLP